MKMIGIISMHRIINYGSFLQAYGLKKMIETQVDCMVQFIDYKFEKSIVSGKPHATIITKLRNNRSVFKYLQKKLYFHKVREALTKDLKGIGIEALNYTHDVDSVVIGSDEVFNCMQPFPVGYSRNLFGMGYEDKKVISYAASFGHTKMTDLVEKGIGDEVKSLLENFSKISVRDNNSVNIIHELTRIEPEIHMDPVLIYEFTDEMQYYRTEDKGYIIVYAYTGRLSFEEEEYIRKFAKTHKKKIYSIGHYSSIADKNIICHPFFVFSYFKNADYIITDTFHGTIFSIKLNSKFCTLIRDSNKNKLEALLKSLNQYERAVQILHDIERLYLSNIDYKKTNEIIENERLRSKQYIQDNL